MSKLQTHEHLQEAISFHQQGDFIAAEKIYLDIIDKNSSDHEALHLFGVLQLQKNCLDEASVYIAKAIDLHNNNPEYYHNFGIVLKQKQDLGNAISSFQKAIHLNSNYVESWYNLGNIFQLINDKNQSLACYNKALSIKPNHYYAHCNISQLLLEINDFHQAITHLKIAAQMDQANVDIKIALANVYAKIKELNLAKNTLLEAVNQAPSNYSCNYNLAVIYLQMNQLRDAFKYANMAYLLDYQRESLLSTIMFEACRICDYSLQDQIKPILINNRRLVRDKKARLIESPFLNNMICNDPTINCEVAIQTSNRLNSTDIYYQKNHKLNKIEKIGFIGCDFYNHPTMHLIFDFLSELTNLKQVYIFSYNQHNDEVTEKIKLLDLVYKDIAMLSDEQIASAIHQENIDILIDLKGHTKDTRLKPLSYRPAPVIMHYLGFPGTTGANFIDYFILDKNFDEELLATFTEKIIYLPDSYQINSKSQLIDKIPSKKSLGFENKILFASFNQTFKLGKIDIATFAKILLQVENSVLWLYSNNQYAIDNIRSAFHAYNVDSSKIYFAKPLPKSQHLARLSIVDIVLDPITCNGHTTTTDALFVNVPVITKKGKNFNQQVASTLLTVSNLEKLVTHDINEYIDLSVNLATNQEMLQRIKQQMIEYHDSNQLFNAKNFANNFIKSISDEIL